MGRSISFDCKWHNSKFCFLASLCYNYLHAR